MSEQRTRDEGAARDRGPKADRRRTPATTPATTAARRRTRGTPKAPPAPGGSGAGVAAVEAEAPAPRRQRRPRTSAPADRRASSGGSDAAPGPGEVETSPAPGPDPSRLSEVPSGLTEEERIEFAKYLPTQRPARVFEEERFLFPENYPVDRVRLLVKDPDWIFAHWSVDPASMAALRSTLGERAMALSRLTLRVEDVDHGGATVILLPYGARSWYVRADPAPRRYRAQIGLTLPTGEFRLLAQSNTVATPRMGPSSARGVRRAHHARPWEVAAAASHPGAPADVGAWDPTTRERETLAEGQAQRGGASDLYQTRGGASDVHRR